MEEQGTKWRMLRFLFVREEATVEEMREEFGLGLTTLREHIYDLLEQELIERRKEKGTRGRPTHYYRLTEKAKNTFPNAGDNLTTIFYRILQRSMDEEKLNKLLQEIMIEYLQETNRQINTLLEKYE